MLDELLDALDWLIEFPQTDTGALLLFLAVVGSFMVALMALRIGLGGGRPYIEFHDNWTANHENAKVIVQGRATVISQAAAFEATCKVWYGDVPAWRFWRRSAHFQLLLTDSGRHMTIPNAVALIFMTSQKISIPEDITELTIAVQMKMSNGSKKSMRQVLPL